MKHNKKGQGALEFLMTYGWAFLVILIMIGALAYFGVLSPSRFLPDRCSLGSEFECDDFQILQGDATLGSSIVIKLTSNIDKNINVTQLNVSAANNDGFTCDDAYLVDGTTGANILLPLGTNTVSDNTGPVNGIPAVNGVTGYFNITDCSGGATPVAGQKFKAVVTIGYRDSFTDLDHILNGEVFGTVQ